uniref:Bone morphogenetic protein 16 n=1 Tax=Oreochromis niloticus TaxID=8128 RepID=I3KXC7_ORENI
MATPVPVLRLPKGPDPNSRGFDPNSPRFIALCRTSISSSAASDTDSEQLQKEQHARSVLREGFLRCLLSMTNKKVQFQMYENVKVEATFGASDIDVLNFQITCVLLWFNATPPTQPKQLKTLKLSHFTFSGFPPSCFPLHQNNISTVGSEAELIAYNFT